MSRVAQTKAKTLKLSLTPNKGYMPPAGFGLIVEAAEKQVLGSHCRLKTQRISSHVFFRLNPSCYMLSCKMYLRQWSWAKNAISNIQWAALMPCSDKCNPIRRIVEKCWCQCSSIMVHHLLPAILECSSTIIHHLLPAILEVDALAKWSLRRAQHDDDPLW